MEEKMDGKKEKKNKKSKFIVWTILILVGVLLAWLKFRNTFTNDNMNEFLILPLGEKVLIIFSVLFIFVLFIILIKFKNNQYIIYGTNFLKNLWICFVFPMLICIIVLLGAIQEKYPIDNPTMETNLTYALNISTGALAGATNKVVMTFYNLGKSHPNISMIVILIIGIMGILVTFWNTSSDMEERKSLQEIIEGIDKEDYEDLEKYEKKLEKKK